MKSGDMVKFLHTDLDFEAVALVLNVGCSQHSGRPFAVIYMSGKIRFVSLKSLRKIS